MSEAIHALTSSALEENHLFLLYGTKHFIVLSRFSKTFCIHRSQYWTTGVEPVASGLKSSCKDLISLSLHLSNYFNLAALAQRWGNCLSLSCLCVHPSFLFPLCYSGILPYLSLPSIQSSIFVCLCLSDLLACSHIHHLSQCQAHLTAVFSLRQQKGPGNSWPSDQMDGNITEWTLFAKPVS